MPQDPRQRDGCRFTAQNITAAQEKNPFAKISDIVYELLEKAIFSSAIPPGSKLNISKLAEQMGVSTSPVTRAVERLEENGLVTAVRSSDSKYRSYFVFDLSSESLEDLFVARRAIEGEAAFLCAQKRTLIDLPRLQKLADQFQSAWQDCAKDLDTAPTASERAKIDLESGNFNMRDPVIYRINHMPHHRTGTKWCIYPMYDFAHPIQDAIEGITHSMCSLEFENHRPLYNWVIENIFGTEFPKQREFARLNMTNTVMSKRYLRELVEMGIVDGWDDPRMPTLCGLRRRGYTPTSIFTFVREAGISKSDNLIDMRQLEACIRSELDLTAQRRIAVLDPVKLIIDNYPEEKTEYFDIANNPNREANDATTRKVAFTRELWIENEDFAEVPPPKFKRLTIGGEVRLMGAYLVKCESIEKNPDGSIAAIHCTADIETGNGNPADGRKVKGTIHWVSAAHAVDAEVRLYDKLFTEANMNAIPEGSDYKDYLNPESVTVRTHCKLEESLKDAKPGEKFQFVRTGFFTPDSKNPGVYNRVVTLRDSFKPAK